MQIIENNLVDYYKELIELFEHLYIQNIELFESMIITFSILQYSFFVCQRHAFMFTQKSRNYRKLIEY